MAKYFKQSEFDDPTQPGSGAAMDPELIRMLDELRERCGFPFTVASGVRTKEHNEKIGGAPNSDHVIQADGLSHGVDIYIESVFRRFKLVKLAMEIGIRRIGVKKNGVHLGNWKDNPQDVLWTYD